MAAKTAAKKTATKKPANTQPPRLKQYRVNINGRGYGRDPLYFVEAYSQNEAVRLAVESHIRLHPAEVIRDMDARAEDGTWHFVPHPSRAADPAAK